jgi:hypothetical protein
MHATALICIEVIAWAVLVTVVVWATVLERQSYSCVQPTKNVVKWGIPLLGLAFLSACGLVVHTLVCGCKCIGCVVERTVGPARLVLGATLSLCCIFVVKYVALPKCATIEQDEQHALLAVASISVVLFVGALAARVNPSPLGDDLLLSDEP